VYRTGREHSNDVSRDLREGTRYVERQTRELVQWYHRNKKQRSDPERCFTEREVSQFSSVLRQTPRRLCPKSIEYGLRMFDFARFNGWSTSEGVECQIAMSLMSRWPCSDGYDASRCIRQLLNTGLLSITRQHVPSPNGTGQARTYLIRVEPDRHAKETVGLRRAIRDVCRALGLL
jgi:hypothetical protein